MMKKRCEKMKECQTMDVISYAGLMGGTVCQSEGIRLRLL
jgi:hypothetical protein